jgi:hypothetical protein
MGRSGDGSGISSLVFEQVREWREVCQWGRVGYNVSANHGGGESNW